MIYILRFSFTVLTGLIAVAFASVAVAQEVGNEEPVRARVAHRGLDNPSGLAIQPRTGHVFIADHNGVHRYVAGNEGGFTTEISSFPSDVYGKGPMYDIGPLGLAFINATQLVVGDGSRPDGEELIRVYRVGREPAEKPQAEADALHTLGPITAGDTSARGEGNYYSVAVGAGYILASSNGDDTKGWVVGAPLNGNKPGKLDGFIATKEATGVDAPVPIIFSPDGDLVVGQMGEVNVPGDSLLTIYDAKTKKLKLKAEIGLSDIAGLAYSPTTGKLYATDFAWAEPDKGGLFRLDIEGEKVTATKILSLDKPTAIAFNRRGVLYIATFGTAREGSDEKPGRLLRIRRGL